jgi:pyrimidine operon attenuation protein/uracil phosphoribosyltransferase
LAVLIDRGGRELPIQPDIVGKTISAAPSQRVDVLVAELDGRNGVVISERVADGGAGDRPGGGAGS